MSDTLTARSIIIIVGVLTNFYYYNPFSGFADGDPILLAIYSSLMGLVLINIHLGIFFKFAEKYDFTTILKAGVILLAAQIILYISMSSTQSVAGFVIPLIGIPLLSMLAPLSLITANKMLR